MSRKTLCTGVSLILISNIIYILNNYTFSWFRLHATEVALVRGVLQVMIFGLAILARNRKLGKLEDAEGIDFVEIFPQILISLRRKYPAGAHNGLPVATDLSLRFVDVGRWPLLSRRHPPHAHRGPHRPLLHLPGLLSHLRDDHTEKTLEGPGSAALFSDW